MTLEGQGRADCWGNTWSGSGIVFLQLADDMLTLNAVWPKSRIWTADPIGTADGEWRSRRSSGGNEI